MMWTWLLAIVITTATGDQTFQQRREYIDMGWNKRVCESFRQEAIAAIKAQPYVVQVNAYCVPGRVT
jgi:hypothetical protein